MADTAKAIDALHSIPPDLPRDEWVKVGMAAHAAGLDFDTFDAWSAGAGNYDAAASRDVWKSIKPGKGIGPGTLYRVGAEHGWRMGEGNGARGWSGIRAAVDTEIEVTDSPTGRCAEITKQRDLSTKGERIGFRLDAVTLGTTKWGAAATSCVVVPADAPDKPQGKRVSEVGGAVLEYLRTQPAGKKKREVVEHFQPLYDKSAVYRELKKLVTAGQVLECIGIVTAASEVRNGAN